MQLTAGELFFNDTSGFDSRSQHVLFSGHVVELADSVQFVEIAVEDQRHLSIKSTLKGQTVVFGGL